MPMPCARLTNFASAAKAERPPASTPSTSNPTRTRRERGTPRAIMAGDLLCEMLCERSASDAYHERAACKEKPAGLRWRLRHRVWVWDEDAALPPWSGRDGRRHRNDP